MEGHQICKSVKELLNTTNIVLDLIEYELNGLSKVVSAGNAPRHLSQLD